MGGPTLVGVSFIIVVSYFCFDCCVLFLMFNEALPYHAIIEFVFRKFEP